MSQSKKILIFAPIVLVIAIFGVNSPVLADEGPQYINPLGQTQDGVGGGSGGGSVVVPSFHEIAPNISISPAIVGSTITRAGAEIGQIPNYDSSDRYLFNGVELIECTTGSSSPSCNNGGTHSTKHENFIEIEYNSSNNKWITTNQSGIVSTYSVIASYASGDYQWGIDTVEDVNNNTVDFDWWCETSGSDELFCYLDEINYNGTEVKIYRESRPGVSMSAIGVAGFLREISYRTDKVTVKTNGSLVREYRVNYDISPSSGQSLISSIVMYGTDGTSALPATTYEYTEDANWDSFPSEYNTSGICDSGLPDLITTTWGSGDFNGDGFDDIWCHRKDHDGSYFYMTQIAYSDEDGTFTVDDAWDHGCKPGDGYFDTGDFNGDGLMDFICQERVAPRHALVSLNNGDGTFGDWVDWTAQCAFQDNAFVSWGLADINGDGKTDWWCHKGVEDSTAQPIKVGISDGTEFDMTTWHSGWCKSFKINFSFGADVNGDGMADALCHPGGSLDVLISTGTGLVESDFQDISGFCGGQTSGNVISGADFNGDGKMDVFCSRKSGGSNPGGIRMMYSTGNTWIDWGSGSYNMVLEGWCAKNKDSVRAGDFNGDGKTDLMCHKKISSSEYDILVRYSNGDGTFSGSSGETWKDNWCDTEEDPDFIIRSLMGGDFNGDGKTDLYCATIEKISQDSYGDFETTLVGSERNGLDLIEKTTSGIGGETTYTYVPASDWDNAPGYGKSNTIISVTQSDGRGWSSTTDFSYSGGMLNIEDGADYGFRYKKTQLPAIEGEVYGPYTETWFYQDNEGNAGLVEKSEYHKGNGNIISKTENIYSIVGDGENTPYKALPSIGWTYQYDGSGASCGSWPCSYGQRFKTELTYDDYGHIILQKQYGNNDVSGDELTIEKSYKVNNTDYVTAMNQTKVFSGIGTGGTKLKETRLFYDGNSSYTSSPTKGQSTKIDEWNSDTSSFESSCTTTSCLTYDSYGNIKTAKDPLGNITTYDYDTTYNKFIIGVDYPESLSTSTAWNYVCGLSTINTNVNGQQDTTNGYDVFCRNTNITGPAGTGAFVDTIYNITGNPNTQYVETRVPEAVSGEGDVWSRSYFDGLGRTYKVESRGLSSGQEILSGEVTFNNRGNIRTAARSRYSGGTQYNTTYDYDASNRIIKTTFPDNNYTQAIYGLRDVTYFDTEGKKTASRVGDNGLTRYVDEYMGATAITTTTNYDVIGRVVSIVDDYNNTTTFETNSLGQITEIDDPDSGISNFEFNARRELTASIDAKNQRTEYTYDDIGRVKSRTTLAGTPGNKTTTFNYDQDVTNFYNKGHLTSVVYPSGAGEEYMFYDKLGNNTFYQRKIDSVEYNFYYQFDPAGRLITYVYPDGDLMGFAYDKAGRIDYVGGIVDEGDPFVISDVVSYNAAGQPTSINYGNGVTTTNTYSSTRGWTTDVYTANGSDVFQDVNYIRDKNGRILEIDSGFASESWEYEYDDLGRLTSATNIDDDDLTQTFQYDNIGNITYNSKIGTYTYGENGHGPHAVTSLNSGTTTYDYDANGNLIDADSNTTFNWDGDNRLSSIDFSTGSISFAYDGLGRRIKKSLGGYDWIFIGKDYEIDYQGNDLKYMGPIVVNSAGDVTWNFSDHLDSKQSFVAADGESEGLRKVHTPFGDRAEQQQDNIRGWIGEIQDETGITYLNERYYISALGRFLSPDPIVGIGQAANRYSYAINDPINFSDPSGLAPVDPNDNHNHNNIPGDDWWKNFWIGFDNLAGRKPNQQAYDMYIDGLAESDGYDGEKEKERKREEEEIRERDSVGANCYYWGINCPGTYGCVHFGVGCEVEDTTTTTTTEIPTTPNTPRTPTNDGGGSGSGGSGGGIGKSISEWGPAVSATVLNSGAALVDYVAGAAAAALDFITPKTQEDMILFAASLPLGGMGGSLGGAAKVEAGTVSKADEIEMILERFVKRYGTRDNVHSKIAVRKAEEQLAREGAVNLPIGKASFWQRLKWVEEDFWSWIGGGMHKTGPIKIDPGSWGGKPPGT